MTATSTLTQLLNYVTDIYNKISLFPRLREPVWPSGKALGW